MAFPSGFASSGPGWWRRYGVGLTHGRSGTYRKQVEMPTSAVSCLSLEQRANPEHQASTQRASGIATSKTDQYLSGAPQ
jgi:hypothetical protein